MAHLEHIIRQPARHARRARQTPLLLQHGAWHGAWCWEQWLDYLPSLGYQVHAISLPGHGGSPHHKRHGNLYSLGDYTDALAGEVNKISPTPVVIGHSMGGAILQKYLETHRLPAAVLLASVPATGILPMCFRLLRRHPVPTLKFMSTFDSYHLVATPELARDLFLSPETTVDVVELQGRLIGESRIAGLQMLMPFAKLNEIVTPVLALAAGNDALFSVAEARATARRYQAEFVLLEGQAHNVMMEPAWQHVADMIDRWITERLELP